MSYKKYLIGDTLKFTYINSGTTFSPVNFVLYSGSETVVDTGSCVDSGNGHWYYNQVMPNTPGYYVGKVTGWVNSYPYPRTVKIRLVTGEVD